MTEDLIVIAITSPTEVADEAKRITELLWTGEADFVHLRKPRWTSVRMENLIREIPDEFRSRLKIHDHFELLDKYHLGGVHLNSRNPSPPPNSPSVSRSLHSVEQLVLAKHYDYVTLSPVFDSISKSGYKSAFDIGSLPALIEGKRVVALGGVTPSKFTLLRKAGFWGAAMLGYFWNE